MNRKARVIAFYLPQYHPTPDNDKWWGKGFTEWTNVGKAKPLFKGHYQPKVPADLGYYDLRLEEVREEQAQLAKGAGVEGFCYYHYWFGDGKQELELPFNEVLRLGKPDYPFCLCWANESWHSKFWSKDGVYSKKKLIEQRYLGKKDNEKHFYHLLPAFKDKRYITMYGKPIFMIYKPLDFLGIEEFISDWQRLAHENGLPGIHFIGQIVKNINEEEVAKITQLGVDGVNIVRLLSAYLNRAFYIKVLDKIKSKILKMPKVTLYKNVYSGFIGDEEIKNNIYPTLIPNWDHTPRSGSVGYVLHKSTPELFEKHINHVLDIVRHKSEEENLIFLKSWNEWGEGNYVEPDQKNGYDYLNALKKSLFKLGE